MVEKINYNHFDDGLGASYERLAIAKVIDRIARKTDSKNLLELNATFIGGVPAFNSYLLAKWGYDIAIAVCERDYQEAVEAWDSTGLINKIKIYKLKKTTEASDIFPKRYDLVWNHLIFEQYQDPSPLIEKMSRIAKKAIVTITLNPYNPGFWFHILDHKIFKKFWNHGFTRQMIIGSMVKAFKKQRLKIIERGGLDCPPWLDTVDFSIGGSMAYAKSVSKEWVWSVAHPEFENNKIIRSLYKMEKTLPNWFKILASHHLYVAGVIERDKK